jgi:hypothetical protein
MIVNILGDDIDTIKKNTQTLIDASNEIGLEVNTEKTKYMSVRTFPILYSQQSEVILWTYAKIVEICYSWRKHRNTYWIKLQLYVDFKINVYLILCDSVVDIATGYGLDDRGVGIRVLVGSPIFPSSCRPDRLLSSVTGGLFPRG